MDCPGSPRARRRQREPQLHTDAQISLPHPSGYSPPSLGPPPPSRLPVASSFKQHAPEIVSTVQTLQIHSCIATGKPTQRNITTPYHCTGGHQHRHPQTRLVHLTIINIRTLRSQPSSTPLGTAGVLAITVGIQVVPPTNKQDAKEVRCVAHHINTSPT